MRFRPVPVAVTVVAALAVALAAPVRVLGAQPAVTVDAVDVTGSTTITVSGTLTCAQPTGQATAQIWAINSQVLEVAQGIGTDTAACADGPVLWAVAISSPLQGWDDRFSLLVSASFRRDGVREGHTLQDFPPGWAG